MRQITKYIIFNCVLFAFFYITPVNASRPTGSFSLGYYASSGNTDETKNNLAFNLKDKRSDKLELDYSGSRNYAKTNGSLSADQTGLTLTSSFIKPSEKKSFYLNADWLKDVFVGYDNKIGMGLGFYEHVIKTEKKTAGYSFGYSLTKEDFTDGTDKTNGWLKTALDYKQKLENNVSANTSVNFSFPNKDSKERYQIDALFGIISPITDKIDLESKYTINYRRTALVEGKCKTDKSFVTSLVYKL